MKYIDAEKLLAEIVKKKNQLVSLMHKIYYAANYKEWEAELNAYNKITSLIECLQQEQTEVDLEKDIQECWQNWLSPSNQNSVDGVLPKEEFAFYARHFYELGKARKEE